MNKIDQQIEKAKQVYQEASAIKNEAMIELALLLEKKYDQQQQFSPVRLVR